MKPSRACDKRRTTFGALTPLQAHFACPDRATQRPSEGPIVLHCFRARDGDQRTRAAAAPRFTGACNKCLTARAHSRKRATSTMAAACCTCEAPASMWRPGNTSMACRQRRTQLSARPAIPPKSLAIPAEKPGSSPPCTSCASTPPHVMAIPDRARLHLACAMRKFWHVACCLRRERSAPVA